MFGRELHERLRRQRALHLLLEVVPVFLTEVVEDHEAALRQVGAQAGDLGVAHRPEAGFGHVGHRVVPEIRIVEGENRALVEVRTQQRDLRQDLHEVAVGSGVVVRPRRFAAEAAESAGASRHGVAQAHERETPVVRDAHVRLVVGRRPDAPPLLLAAERRLRAQCRDGQPGEGGGRHQRADRREPGVTRGRRHAGTPIPRQAGSRAAAARAATARGRALPPR